MKNYYKVTEVAEKLNLSLRIVQYKLQEGEIKAERDYNEQGRPYLVHYKNIKKYINNQIEEHKEEIKKLENKKKQLFNETFF